MNQQPTNSAIKLAVKLGGHYACQCYFDSRPPCDDCLSTARTIDTELLLPEKHAALLLAQALIDAMEGDDPADDDAMDNLRTALAKLR